MLQKEPRVVKGTLGNGGPSRELYFAEGVEERLFGLGDEDLALGSLDGGFLVGVRVEIQVRL